MESDWTTPGLIDARLVVLRTLWRPMVLPGRFRLKYWIRFLWTQHLVLPHFVCPRRRSEVLHPRTTLDVACRRLNAHLRFRLLRPPSWILFGNRLGFTRVVLLLFLFIDLSKSRDFDPIDLFFTGTLWGGSDLEPRLQSPRKTLCDIRLNN